MNASGGYVIKVEHIICAGVLITLQSTHHVFKALDELSEMLENTGLNKEFKAETIAAPRDISSQCGVCLLCGSIDSPLWKGSSAWNCDENDHEQNVSYFKFHEDKNALLLKKIKKLELIIQGDYSNIYIVKMDFEKRKKHYEKTA